jgi:hypothetical protein
MQIHVRKPKSTPAKPAKKPARKRFQPYVASSVFAPAPATAPHLPSLASAPSSQPQLVSSSAAVAPAQMMMNASSSAGSSSSSAAAAAAAQPSMFDRQPALIAASGSLNKKSGDINKKSGVPVKLSDLGGHPDAMAKIAAFKAKAAARPPIQERPGGWYSKHGPIQLVDFTGRVPAHHLTDEHEALTCMTVATMTGNRGSLTHLNYGDVDPTKFAEALERALGPAAKGAKVILAGGNWASAAEAPLSARGQSFAFHQKLRAALIDRGFDIVREDVGGGGGRTSSLYAGHVSVAQKADKPPTILQF